MKIYVEKRPAEKPETAWVRDHILYIQYHKWDDQLFDYTDAFIDIPLLDITDVVMVYGPRRGFRGLRLLYKVIYRDPAAGSYPQLIEREIRFSKNHTGLVIQIYDLLKSRRVRVRKETVYAKKKDVN